MHKLQRAIDRFCVKHPRFGIANLMLYICIGNAAVFLFSLMDTTGLFESYLLFSPAHILRGQIWRLLTFALIPNSSGIWTLIFIYFYYFIGHTLENEWGYARFNLYFFSGILLTVLYGFLLYFITGLSVPVSAWYVYLSMFFSFAALNGETQVLLFFILPIKIKWLAYLEAGYFLLELFSMPFPLNLLPLVAVFNFLLFCWDNLFSSFRIRSRQQRKATVDFKREVSRINAERRTAPYRFRCEVCGRTDITDPSLEFRYCSRCSGYHCYCAEHINAHRHISE